jgi:hypothetical protein
VDHVSLHEPDVTSSPIDAACGTDDGPANVVTLFQHGQGGHCALASEDDDQWIDLNDPQSLTGTAIL